MTAPGVSVIVPTRGRPELVEQLLSALHEVRTAYDGPSEVVLCDSSTGEARSRIEARAATVGARVAWATPGFGRQHNAAVAAACHPMLWFVDSDCRPTPGALAALVAALATDDAVAAAGRVELVSDGSLVAQAACDSGVVAAFDGFGAPAGSRLPWAVTANLLVRRSALQAVGGFDEELPAGEDVDVGLRLARIGPIRWVPSAVVHHDVRTWSGAGAMLRRFWSYGSADAHLLARHPQLRGPIEPSVANTAPLAVAAALVATRSPRLAARRVVLWAAASTVTVIALSPPRRGRHLARAALRCTLLECLHLARQVRAVRLGEWRLVWRGTVLDPEQRQREAAARRRTGLGILVASPVLVRPSR